MYVHVIIQVIQKKKQNDFNYIPESSTVNDASLQKWSIVYMISFRVIFSFKKKQKKSSKWSDSTIL